MKKTKVMRGHPIYVYRKSSYLDKPDSTIVKKMLYDEDENVTYAYCAKPGNKIEVICSLILLVCVLCNIIWLHDSKVIVRYNSVSTYYNGSLYLNLINDDTSITVVNYELRDDSNIICSGILNPGDIIISTPIGNIKDTYVLRISYKTLLTEHVEDIRINVVDRSV